MKSIDIQLSFPDEPDYSEVPLAVLYELVETYEIEQSCATSAIYELHRRKDSRLQELCIWVINQPHADEFLKACAREKGCVQIET
jgi:hypothetical protein